MVHGPYAEFRLMAAKRTVSDRKRRDALFDAQAYKNLAAGIQKELDDTKLASSAKDAKIDTLASTVGALQQNLIQCGMDKAALRSWATVGRITVGLVTAGVGTVATVLILNSAKP